MPLFFSIAVIPGSAGCLTAGVFFLADYSLTIRDYAKRPAAKAAGRYQDAG